MFEDKHRGSRELIKSRLAFYLPFIKPLTEVYPDGPSMDLGCGRGEWLEVLSEQTNLDAHGVDMDSAMLAVCEQYTLQCKLQDAVSCLKALKSNSQGIVSGFHIAEHIPFPQLQELVQEAHRVLKPAGLLILETPNPENIVVGTAEFYMDPTHQQPLPPNLLAFVAEYNNFKRTKIVRLQETADVMTSARLSILDVLKGVSPDYAIIAQKKGSKEALEKFDECFEKEYGYTLEMLAGQYDIKIRQLEERTQSSEARMLVSEAKIQAAEAKTQALTDKLHTLQNSISWQITAPLRNTKSFLKNKLEQIQVSGSENQQIADMSEKKDSDLDNAEKKEALESLLEKDYEQTLEMLAKRNDQQRMLEKEQAALKVQAVEVKMQAVEAKKQATLDEIDHLQNTLSWKATAPVRDGIDFLKNHFIKKP